MQHRAGVAPLVLGLAMAAGPWGCGASGGPAGSGQNGAGSGMVATSGLMGGGGGATGSTSGSGASGGGSTGSTGGSGASSGDSPDAAGGAPDATGTPDATGGAPDATGGDGSYANPADSVVWLVDNLQTIGSNPSYNLMVVGAPMVIDTPAGKAVQFNGVGDALFVPKQPVDGYAKFTAEVIFRPDIGGAQAQRWFHMAGPGGDNGPTNGSS